MVPKVQKAENTTIQVPLLGEGMNSRNQEESTGPPPKPTPTKPRRIISKVKFGAKALKKPAAAVTIAVMRNPFLIDKSTEDENRKHTIQI